MLTGVRGAGFATLLAMYVLVLCLDATGLFKPDVWTLLVIHTVLSVAVLLVVRARIEHPATLFTLIFWFYVAAYPIVVALGYLTSYGVTTFVVTLNTIGYLGFVLPTLVIKTPKIPNYSYMLPDDSVKTIRIGLVVLVIMGTLQMAASLATHSYKGGGWQYIILATSAPQMYVVVGAAILLSQWLFTRYRLPVFLSIAIVIFTLVPLFITGRRTPGLIAVIAIIVLLEIRRRRLNLIKLSAIVFIGFVAVGVSKSYSTVLTTGHEVNVKAFFESGWKNFFSDLFYREFKDEGRITAASIVYGRSHNFPTYGKTYLSRLENDLAPGFLLQKNPNGITQQLNVFITHGGTTTGLGYSIIAEGYNNFGVPGVFFNLFLLGMLATYLYQRAGRSPVRLGIYVVFIGILCSRLRSGTLAVYLMSFYSLLMPLGLFCLARLLFHGRVSDRLALSRPIKNIKSFSTSIVPSFHGRFGGKNPTLK